MAFEDENAYSLSNHNHDTVYNKTEIIPLLTDGIQVATFVKDYQNEISVYYPQIITYKYDEPYIGELKFVTDKRHRTININSDDFDGWVYPDGSTYLISDFPRAASEFGSVGSTFQVPLLSQFFCGSKTKDQNVEATEVLKEHFHFTKLTLEPKEITGTLYLGAAKDAGGDGFGHNGKAKTFDRWHRCTVTMVIDSFEFSGNNQSDNCEQGYGVTTPSYNYIPVMIYIGQKNGG